MTAPTLGELARQTRLIDNKGLDDALRHQRQNYLEGDFRRLGEILVDHGVATRPAVRGLLQRQGLTIVECELCQTRYNAIMFRGQGLCLRCGRRLAPSDEHAALTVEDAISGGGPQADLLLREHRQRNPRLGRYEVLGEVGRGAMGVIYKAFEADLHRNVALKFLRPGPEGISPEDKERFRREARAVARLRHDNIVQAHAIDEANGLVFMSMDFVPGVSLELLGRKGALPQEQIVTIGSKIARALHYAHEQGIVHRDVKPGNIVIDKNGAPFLVDFGIAKNRSESTSLTTEGEILGSLAYMAPEYITKGNAALDRRCDVYGLGVAIYEALSAKLPFGEDEDERLVLKILKEEPAALGKHRSDLMVGLEAVVMRAIARDRDKRYQSCADLAQDLEAVARGTLPTIAAEAAPATPPPSKLEQSQKRPSGRPLGESQKKPAVPPAPSGRAAALNQASDDASTEIRSPVTGAGSARSLAPILGMGGAILVVLVLGFGLVIKQQSDSAASLRVQIEQLKAQAGETEIVAGQAFEKAGDLASAEQHYTIAIRLLADSPDPLEARANVRKLRGDAKGELDDRTEANVRRAHRAPPPAPGGTGTEKQ